MNYEDHYDPQEENAKAVIQANEDAAYDRYLEQAD